MARRASSSLHPGFIIGGIAIVVVLVVAGKILINKKDTPFDSVPKLRVSELLENGNSLRGSEYTIQGKVDDQLRWDGKRGQIISLRVEDEGSEEFVAIEIPSEFSNINIEREQRYAFRVKFERGGLAVATGVTRL